MKQYQSKFLPLTDCKSVEVSEFSWLKLKCIIKSWMLAYAVE